MPVIYVKHKHSGSYQSYTIRPSQDIEELRDLIEETEGIDVANQFLHPDGDELELMSLEPLRDSPGVTIILDIVITVCVFQEPFFISQEKTVGELADLVFKSVGRRSGHVRRQLSLMFKGEYLNERETLEDAGIVEGTFLDVEWNPLSLAIFGTPAPVPIARVVGLFDWDGDMKHPDIRGLPIKAHQELLVVDMTAYGWCYGRRPKRRGMSIEDEEEGHFPRNFVELVEILDASKALEIGDDDPAQGASSALPQLPAFPYPTPKPAVMKVKFGDWGHSLVHAELSFPKAPLTPGALIPAKVILRCLPVHPRRVTFIRLQLHFPANEVIDIQPRKLLGPETITAIQDARNQNLSVSGSISGQDYVQVGMDWEHGRETTKEATRATRSECTGVVLGGDTAVWTFKEDIGEGGQHGVDTDRDLTFYLRSRPVRAEWECVMMHQKNERSSRKTGGGDIKWLTGK